MIESQQDKQRENRIFMEAIVDCYNEEERAMGWYYYLDNKLSFPFKAKCIMQREISPLKIGDELNAVGMGSEDECEHEMFVMTDWKGTQLAVPLIQLMDIDANEATHEAIEDWLYWINRGYGF